MQATTERRQQILEYISIHRHVQYQDLMDEFHISKKTAQRDVEILSCSYPIYTRTTCAGGIFAMEGWYASKCLRQPETVVEGAFLRSFKKFIVLWYNLFDK